MWLFCMLQLPCLLNVRGSSLISLLYSEASFTTQSTPWSRRRPLRALRHVGIGRYGACAILKTTWKVCIFNSFVLMNVVTSFFVGLIACTQWKFTKAQFGLVRIGLGLVSITRYIHGILNVWYCGCDWFMQDIRDSEWAQTIVCLCWYYPCSSSSHWVLSSVTQVILLINISYRLILRFQPLMDLEKPLFRAMLTASLGPIQKCVLFKVLTLKFYLFEKEVDITVRK